MLMYNLLHLLFQ